MTQTTKTQIPLTINNQTPWEVKVSAWIDWDELTCHHRAVKGVVVNVQKKD